MNRHFTDAAYYARRAADATVTGLRQELEPATERARKLAGRVPETDPSTPERVRQRAGTVEREARQRVRRVRQRI